MTLIPLTTIVEKARSKGFRVREAHFNSGCTQLEIFAPDHEGADEVWHNGCCYGRADFVISDHPESYGYNGFFCGPWHRGYAQASDYGVQKLQSHPAY